MSGKLSQCVVNGKHLYGISNRTALSKVPSSVHSGIVKDAINIAISIWVGFRPWETQLWLADKTKHYWLIYNLKQSEGGTVYVPSCLHVSIEIMSHIEQSYFKAL